MITLSDGSDPPPINNRDQPDASDHRLLCSGSNATLIEVAPHDRLRLRRKARNLNQDEVAAQLSASRQVVANLEAGRTARIDPAIVAALARVYEVSPEEIVADIWAAVAAAQPSRSEITLGTVSEIAEDIEAHAGAERGGAA